MARILARNFIAPIKHVRFLLLIARGKQDVLQLYRTRRNGIAPCAARHKLLLIGRLLTMSKKSCLVRCGLEFDVVVER
jgi:hypothetical protein